MFQKLRQPLESRTGAFRKLILVAFQTADGAKLVVFAIKQVRYRLRQQWREWRANVYVFFVLPIDRVTTKSDSIILFLFFHHLSQWLLQPE